MTEQVYEIGREWRQVGSLAFVLVIIEIVYYLGKIFVWIWDKLTNRPKRVERRVWKSRRRERVIKRVDLSTYSPANDPQHPHNALGIA